MVDIGVSLTPEIVGLMRTHFHEMYNKGDKAMLYIDAKPFAKWLSDQIEHAESRVKRYI